MNRQHSGQEGGLQADRSPASGVGQASAPSSVLQPSASQLAISQPSTPPLSISQPSASQLAISQPSTPPLSISQPSASQLAISQPSTPPLSISQPSASQLAISQSSIPQPSALQPSALQPSALQPSISQQPISQSSISQPSISQQPIPQQSCAKQPWQQRISERLAQCRRHDSWRQRLANEQGSGRWLIADQRRYLNFSSNDYLGLSQHPAVINAWCEGLRRYGAGSGGSGHVTGYHRAHQQLEQALSDWLGYPRALLFSSGFAANQAVISTFAGQGDSLFADKLSHSSLLDAAMHSPAQLRRFAHNNVDGLRVLLEKPASQGRMVITEGVFSMDGDRAPLADIATLSQQHQALLLVDDAHGIGVLGEQGRGSCWLAGVRPDVLVITFGKAFAVGGAAVLCDETLADYLLQFARHWIYSTHMTAAQAMALQMALTVIRQQPWLRHKLQRHIARFRAGLAESPCALSASTASSRACLPFTLSRSTTAIQPLMIGDNSRAQTLAQRLRQRGVWLTAIRPPSVPPGTARLRVTLTAAHEEADIEQLLDCLRHFANE